MGVKVNGNLLKRYFDNHIFLDMNHKYLSPFSKDDDKLPKNGRKGNDMIGINETTEYEKQYDWQFLCVQLCGIHIS